MDSSTRCRFGLFEFDFRSGELRKEGQVVKLSPQPSRVLALLLARPGEIVLREELRTHLWGDDTFVDFERGLNFCILQVRSALGDSSDNPRFVQTVPRKGYRFIAPVAATSVLPATADLRPQTDADVRPPLGFRPSIAMVAAALVILAPLLWLALSDHRDGRAADSAGPQNDRMRIAVLPFVNLTGDSKADYLADGLTDEVISQLGRLGVRRLAVIARTSVMTYRRTPKSVAEIGRELNATYVVESSMRQEGDVLRIASSLVPTSDQSPIALWSEQFGKNSTTDDGQTNAAVRLARLIALELTSDATADLRRPTHNLAAWDAFLQGRAALNRATPDDVQRAIAQFEVAVQSDPTFAAAWAKLAEARHVLVMIGAAAPVDAYPAARTAADRALSADANLPDAHVARGLVQLWYDFKATDAAASFERALALNGSHPVAMHDYAWAKVAQGRNAEAVSSITAARDLDPLSTRANNDIGWLYLRLRQPTEAIRACRHTLAIHPESLEAQSCLETAHVQLGQYDDATRAARAALPRAVDVPGIDGAEGLAAMQSIWRWRVARLEEAAQTRWVNPYTLATHLARIGQTDRALDQLEAAVAARVGMVAFLGGDPALDPLRTQPRFQALLSRVNEMTR